MGDFSLGTQSWSLGGQAQLAPSDRGAGQVVQVLHKVEIQRVNFHMPQLKTLSSSKPAIIEAKSKGTRAARRL